MPSPDFPNWFQWVEAYFQRNLRRYRGEQGARFLQIGVFTGDATVWMLNEILIGEGAVLIDVDTWAGSCGEQAHAELSFAEVEACYDRRTDSYRKHGRLIKYRCTSREFFRCHCDGEQFDFVYIDGDHRAPVVLSDAIEAYRVLKKGGYLAFDDYCWTAIGGEVCEPRPAIDTFLSIYAKRVRVVDQGEQLWVKRVA